MLVFLFELTGEQTAEKGFRADVRGAALKDRGAKIAPLRHQNVYEGDGDVGVKITFIIILPGRQKEVKGQPVKMSLRGQTQDSPLTCSAADE